MDSITLDFSVLFSWSFLIGVIGIPFQMQPAQALRSNEVREMKDEENEEKISDSEEASNEMLPH